jgi:mRNA deadenylase 3'-5' endonuclease subunit Ccr4
MGTVNSKAPNDDEIEVIRSDMETMTPIVGIELTPTIHLQYIGACVFEWYRLPKSNSPPVERVINNTKREVLKSQSYESEQIEESDSDSDDTKSEPMTHELSISLTDLKPIKMDYNVNDNPLSRGVSITSPTSSATPTLPTTTPIDMSKILDNLPIIVSQSANYTPTLEDVGHRLRFTVVFIGTQAQGRHIHENTTETTISLPATLPKRIWIKNKIFKQAKLQYYPTIDHLGILDQVQRKNCKTKVMSYDLYGDRVLECMRDRSKRDILLPNCPDFALTEAYRRKALFIEITGYTADIVCLQCIHAKEYNRWYNDLSMKSGLSGILMCNDPEVTQNKHPYDDDVPIDYHEHRKFGMTILYKRSKFMVAKEWSIRVSDQDIPSNLDQEQRSQCEQFVRSNVIIGMIVELEFRDIMDMMAYMMKYSSCENLPQVTSFDSIRLLVVNVQLVQSDVGAAIQYLQAKTIVSQLEKAMASRDYASMKVRPCVILNGNFRSDHEGIVYRYLSKNMTPAQQRLHLATMCRSIDRNQKSNSVFEPSQQDIVHSAPVRSELEASLLNSNNELNLQSSIGVVLGEEQTIMVSDPDMSIRKTTDFMFYTPNCLQVRRIAKEGSKLAHPNALFASEHVAIVAEFELTLLQYL